MVEITEISDTSTPNQSTKSHADEESENRGKGEAVEGPDSESDFDPTKMRKTKPGKKRLFLTLSVLLSFLLGLPFLIKSVEIYRSPLPFRDVDSLSTATESDPLLFPCHFQAVFVGFNSEFRHEANHAQKLGLSIAYEMRRLAGDNQACGTCGSNFSVSVTIDSNEGCVEDQDLTSGCSWRCGSLNGFDFDIKLGEDKLVDDLLSSALVEGEACLGYRGKTYSVVVVNGDGDVRAVVGKNRHGWIVGEVSEEDAVKKIAEIFVQVFINGGKPEGSIRGEFMPVGADGRLVLSFSLLNADPSDWIYDWDFQRVEEALLTPVVQALKPIAKISIESQILYHTPKSFSSRWDGKSGSYVFNTKDLPFFVNSNEWHLDTSIAAGGRSKVLHIIMYVPSANECPLVLKLPNGEISKTNSFISPMWGGIIVWNPSSCSRSSQSKQPARHLINFQDLQNVAEVFMGQLRQLFGLKSEDFYDASGLKVSLLASKRGFTQWELDVLSRQHACFNLVSCATTLGSLSKLVQSLPRMIIMDEIGKQVEFSLQAAKLARRNASHGIYSASAESSLQARSLAEDAFYHPSIMSVSHNSFEHYFAVYSPFFLPVAMHVLLAAIREWKRYKLETKKYLAWRSKADVSG